MKQKAFQLPEIPSDPRVGLFKIQLKLKIVIQARKQEFFRLGGFPWNLGTSMNILSTTHDRKTPQDKMLAFFSWKLLKLHDKYNP